MPRDDYERRRLYALYERSKRRLAALADARDRRRVGADEDFAPRRFLVSERKLRSEGFGRGGAQVRRVWRRQRGEGANRAERRFADRGGVFRRGNRDRFRREDDMDRELRRERMRDDGRDGRRERRFGLARRRRLQIRDSRRGGASQKGGPRGRSDAGQRRSSNKADRRSPGGGKVGSMGGAGTQPAARSRGGQGRRRTSEPLPTRDQLDAQLESYRNN